MKEISAIQEAYMDARARADGIDQARNEIWRRWMQAPRDEFAGWKAAYEEMGVILAHARAEASRLLTLWMREPLDTLNNMMVDAMLVDSLPARPQRRVQGRRRHG